MREQAPSSQGVLPAGAMLGRYELLGLLSVGGMAEIYLARVAGIAGFEKLVVVKRMLPHLARQHRFVEMFLAEARLGAMLAHPNVVQVNDIGEETGNYFYAMDYVRGPDLRRIMNAARGPLPLHCAVAIGAGLCAGLDHAHDLVDGSGKLLGVVHRDVTLSNVLVSYDGTVKVTDFGVAKLTNDDRRTRSGSLKGKIGYMSPEQCRGDELDRRSDLFSVGIILYELTTGRRLFRPRKSELEILQRISREDVEPPSRLDPDYPRPLEDIVMRALRRDRDERYASARELQRDLEAMAMASRLAVAPHELGEYVRALVPPAPVALDLTRPTGSPQLAVRPPDTQSGARPIPWGKLVAGLLVAMGVGAITALVTFDPPVPETSPAPVPPPRVTVAVPEPEPEPVPEPVPEPEPVIEAEPESEPDPDAPRRRTLPVRKDPPRRHAPIRVAAPAAVDAAPDLIAPPPPPLEPERELVDAAPPPAPEPVAAPEPKPAPPAAKPKPKPKKDPGSLDAAPSLASIDVDGPLADSEIRRAVERVLPAFRACYRDAAADAKETPSSRAKLRFSIDETRAARGVQASGGALPGLNACLEGAAVKIKTRIAPDVGAARVTLTVAFDPT